MLYRKCMRITTAKSTYMVPVQCASHAAPGVQLVKRLEATHVHISGWKGWHGEYLQVSAVLAPTGAYEVFGFFRFIEDLTVFNLPKDEPKPALPKGSFKMELMVTTQFLRAPIARWQTMHFQANWMLCMQSRIPQASGA